MTRVIHTGDTHLGYRQYHLPERRADFLAAFRQVIEDAIEAEVDAVVHAGDLFNDRRPGLIDLRETISVLETLRAAEIPFLAVVGNHEDARDGQWIDLFEQLGLATHLDAEGTVIGDTAFYGLDYVPGARRDALDYEFEPRSVPHAALVSHGRFKPFPHGDWDLETILTEANLEFDAALLGDDHVPDQKRVAGAWAAYCGSTERASASERDPRGYNIVTFDDGVSITRRTLDTREFVFIDVELASSERASIVKERVRAARIEDAVVIVTIQGEGETIPPAEIEAVGDEAGALITRVNDRRELDTEAETTVSFADPDEAVTERVREMGLSDVAHDIEGLVRSEDLAQSNLRDRVIETVTDRLDDPTAFEPVGDEPADSTEEPSSADTDESGSGDGRATKNATMEEFL
ncbi:DNA double-strand break repair protein Mre11 [Halodesulfurarchaeum formicicum]|uniref:DNA double-strand break repair protein Mre11 n=1 Tax=Halodesulfurarchaeum formicicum TaxID=1873524 RepID=A0A1J1AD18_9EURY|nr:DNA double-strand break repair protein Mre11 [Halodesulfurarchaeum formicicum]APE95465.1 metallophosphoesterase [Halodesulfurarchaeum formicicum]